MKNNSSARNSALSLLGELRLSEPSLDDLVKIVQSFGFEIIDFTQDETDEDIQTLISELGLAELIRTSRAFVYQKQDVKLLFVNDSMTADEKRYAIAHELGHIVLKHTNDSPGFTTDMEDEFEANEFAHYLLHPGTVSKRAMILPQNSQPKQKASNKGSRWGLALLMIFGAVLVFLGFRTWSTEAKKKEDRAYQMAILDPLSYIQDGKVFGKPIDAYLAGLTEGKDYFVTDVYGDKQVHAYRFHPSFNYFGVPEGNTGVRLFTEADEGITMVCYDFVLASADINTIDQKLQAMMACIRQAYSRGYDYGLYYDPQDSRKYINFDDFLNGIHQNENGSYSITWVLEQYGVSLDLNYDKNQEVSLGSIRFYIPRKKNNDSERGIEE